MKNPAISRQFVKVPLSFKGKRLDQAAAELFPTYSRSRLQTWIKQGQLLVNEQIKTKTYKIQGHEGLSLLPELPDITPTLTAEAIPLNIVYEDESLLVIEKPAGLIVHPGAGNAQGTLINGLIYAYPELKNLPRAGIIHRLDKDTSGLLVVARTAQAHNSLVQQLQARLIKREYEAIVQGELRSGGSIETFLGRHPHNRLKRAVVAEGKWAKTHYRIIQRFQQHTHLRVNLETGRTHQIRVHLAHIHHPIVGDPLYSRLLIPKNCSENLISELRQWKRQALHAVGLSLVHPGTKEWISWRSTLPQDMLQILNILKSEVVES